MPLTGLLSFRTEKVVFKSGIQKWYSEKVIDFRLQKYENGGSVRMPEPLSLLMVTNDRL